MGDLLVPRAALVMKVGFHVAEEWAEIVTRKLAELDSAGVVFWGYGGSACNPAKQVQPFALASDHNVEVAMLHTKSRFQSDDLWAEAMSVDEQSWHPIPGGVRTSGKWALVLDRLEIIEAEIDLGDYEIAVGPSEGRPATEYLRGQSDKACLRRTPGRSDADCRAVVMRGRLSSPWAVFLR
jgi:hypothetical protein